MEWILNELSLDIAHHNRNPKLKDVLFFFIIYYFFLKYVLIRIQRNFFYCDVQISMVITFLKIGSKIKKKNETYMLKEYISSVRQGLRLDHFVPRAPVS